jgi:hypothetical protein
VCSAALFGDGTPLSGGPGELVINEQGETMYQIVATPEVVVGTLIIVAGLAWLMGTILLWDYRVTADTQSAHSTKNPGCSILDISSCRLLGCDCISGLS